MKKPKAIYFEIKRPFINPRNDLTVELLGEIFDLTMYGPGHTSRRDFKNDLSEVCDDLGPFQAAFIQDSIYENPVTKNLVEYHQDSFFEDFGKNFDRIKAHKFLISNIDPYHCSQKQEEDIIQFPGKIISLPHYFIDLQATQEAKIKENLSAAITNRFHNALKKREFDVIPYTFFVHEREFATPKKRQHYDVSVPGVLYYERRKVLNTLQACDTVKVIDKYKPIRLIEIIEYFNGKNFNGVAWVVFVRQKLFRRMINNSLTSFTDGSLLSYPVRKFFEIPAFGSVLLAKPFYNYERLGFEDGVNFLSVSNETIIEKVEFL